MVSLWRVLGASVLAVACYFLCHPMLAALLRTVRVRLGKKCLWIRDLEQHVLRYLSWLCFALLLILIAKHVLQLDDGHVLVQALKYTVAVPLVLVTFTLRIVLINLAIRYFRWDRHSNEHHARVLIVSEVVKFICFIIVIVELFYVFFHWNEMAGFLVLELIIGIELVVVLASFTSLKNVTMGLFLVFTEPFRIGSYCRVRELFGYVERVSLSRTLLRRADGSLVYIPNGIFTDREQVTEVVEEDQSLIIYAPTSYLLPGITPEQLRQELETNLLELWARSSRPSRESLARMDSLCENRTDLADEDVQFVALTQLNLNTIRIEVPLRIIPHEHLHDARTKVNIEILRAVQSLTSQSAS